MKVLIVGAGIGGLTLAALLNKNKSFSVDIIEKSEKFSHVGFTIGIWANGRRILNKIGIEKELFDKAIILKKYQLYNKKGKKLVDFNLKKYFSHHWPAEMQIQREQLHRLLLKRAGKKNIQLNTTISSLIQKNNGVEIIFSNGKTSSYDLVVGADGLHSTTRSYVGTCELEDLGIRNYWMWIPKIKQFPDHATVEVSAPDEFFGMYPHGGDKTCAIFVHDSQTTQKEQIDLQKFFPTIFSVVPELQNIKTNTGIFVDNGIRVRMSSWYNKRVVLLGDAVHAFESFGGTGGTMAMEDAYVLSQELFNNAEISVALKNYETKRKPRVDMARTSAGRLRRWKVTSNKVFIAVRDVVAPLVPLRMFTREYEYLMENEL